MSKLDDVTEEQILDVAIMLAIEDGFENVESVVAAEDFLNALEPWIKEARRFYLIASLFAEVLDGDNEG